ncbi:MAG: fibronectin type III domain-containing protein [Candidatus Aminicenantes bacterium]|nr:fibronectin type III domain-containing protein [Candidatus Aminicenantes bacterium]
MKKFFPLLFLASLLVLFLSCGKKGPILPPVPKIIQKVEAFEISQRGEKLLLEWENPTAYIDGSPVSEITEVEIWVMEIEKGSAEKEETEAEGPAKKKTGKSGEDKKEIPEKRKNLTPEEFEKNARLIASVAREKLSQHLINPDSEPGIYRYSYLLSDRDFRLDRLVFGLRVKGKGKRKSEFSRLLSVRPAVISLPPREVKASVFKDRIELRWTAADKNFDQSSPASFRGFNVYRFEEKGQLRRLNEKLIKEEKFDDNDFLLGKVYRYFVRASATEPPPFMESGDSDVVEVQAEDKFAPAAPSGLISIAAESYISLTWDDNKEADLAGYRVWRRIEGESEFKLLTPQPIRGNAFSDTKVEKNKRYDYAVTALDKAGNESPRSKSVSEIIKDGIL